MNLWVRGTGLEELAFAGLFVLAKQSSKRTKDDKIIVREEYHESPLRRTHPEPPVREVVLIFTTNVVKKFESTKYLVIFNIN